jgi:signal transduction histidine kinase
MISLRRLVRVKAAIFGLLVAILVLVNLYANRESEFHIERGAAASAATLAYRALELETTRYFREFWKAASQERYAEALAVLDDRRAIESSRSRLRQSLTAEIALLRSGADRQDEALEVKELERIAALTGDHERQLRAAVLEAMRGNGAAALRRMRDIADSALFGELSMAIDDAVSHEIRETIEAEHESHRTQRVILAVPFVLAALLVLLLGLVGVFVTRNLVAPIESLGKDLVEAGLDPHTAIERPQRGPAEMQSLVGSYNRLLRSLRERSLDDAGHRVRLETAVEARTADLREANRQLERADRERIRFLSDVSHEIKTPLTLIRGEAEIALRRTGAEVAEQRQALRHVKDLSDQIAFLVEDLLFIARQRDAAAPLNKVEVDVADLLNGARLDALALARVRDQRVEVSLPEFPARVRADRDRLRQALLILLDNAARYAAQGGLIELAAAQDSGRIRISVANDGPGIEAGELPYVFDRYFRGSDALRSAPGGVGLGLVLARAIARAHNGDVSAASVPGQRTVFSLDLPADGAAS